MSELLRALAAVRSALARRRAAQVLLGVGAAVAAAWAAGAFLAWAGLFRALPWAPLAWWTAALAALALALRRMMRAARLAGVATLRDAAALVEGEQGLRRGSLMGLVDASAGTAPGTSAALLGDHARRIAGRLPREGPALWAPVAWRRDARRFRRSALGLAVALAAAVAGFAVAGDAAAALASPLRAVRAGFGTAVELTVSATHVRRGGAVTVSVRTPGAARASLFVREPGESWHPVTLAADASGHATYRLGGLLATVHLYATAGGASSDTVTIAVLQPAALTDFAVTAAYPAYLGREDEVVPVDAGPLALPVGTVLSLRARASAELGSAALVGGEVRVPLEVRADSATGRLVVRGDGAWHLALTDQTGQDVPEPLPTLDVRAVADSAPVVTVAVPGADTTAPLDLRQALVVDARDDHALARVEVVSWRVSRTGLRGDTAVDSLPGAAGADHVVLSGVLDLTPRGLFPGDTLRYFVRAFDRAPVPHVGVSPSFALRLLSTAELRDAVRAGGDSLAREASALAGDQTALGRRTEDLAAQRDRAVDAARAGAPRPDAGAPQAGPGQMPFEQAQQAGRIREEQERLVQRAVALRRDLANLSRAAAEAGINDPAWQQQLRELDDLMRQAITPEMAQRLEELRRALERLDPEAVRQALTRLAESQRELRAQLERSRELFERAALEGALETAALDAEALQRAESLWAQRAPARRDSAGAAEEQRSLGRDLDSLSVAMRRLAEKVRQRADSAGAAAPMFARQQARAEAARRAMAAAARQMAEGARQEAAQQGRAAADSLRPMAQDLRAGQQSLSAGWRAEVLKLLNDATHEAVTLAAEQQRLAREVREGSAGPADARGREGALQQGVGQVVRRLAQAAGENALVSPRLGASLGRAQREMEEARQSLEGAHPSPDAAAEQGDQAARSLSAAAMEMIRNGETVAGSQSGSGLAEALRQMAALANQQGALSDQAGGLFPMLGSGDAMMQQLRAMAARQRAIADQLERLGSAGLPGHPEQLSPEARALADRLEQGRLDRQTLERQQRLFHRMLDAGRTLRNDDDEREPERRSQTAREGPVASPPGRAPADAGLRYPLPPWEALRGLAPAERAMVLDYFRRLNDVVPR